MAKINNGISPQREACAKRSAANGVIVSIEWGSASSQSHLLRRVGEI